MKPVSRKTQYLAAALSLTFVFGGVAVASNSPDAQQTQGVEASRSAQATLATAIGWAVMSRGLGLAQPHKPGVQPAAAVAKPQAAAEAARTAASPKSRAEDVRSTTRASESGKTTEKAQLDSGKTSEAVEVHRSTRRARPVAEAQVEETREAPIRSSVAGSASIKPESSAAGRTDRIVQFAHMKDEQAAPLEKASTVKMGFGVVFKLALVLGLAYVSILALKLLSTKRSIVSGSRQDMRVVDTIKLTPTNSLHVVDFNGKKMLVGSSSGQVNLLREFEGEELPNEGPAVEGRFAEYLSKYSGGSSEKGAAGRVAGLLRDCAAHLKTRQGNAKVGNQVFGETHEA